MRALGLALAVIVLSACGDDATSTADGGARDAGEDGGPRADVPYVPPPPPEPPPSEPGLHDVEILETRQIVPGAGLPAEAETQQSNNNLDVVRHTDGRVYLAFRTGPHHFANPDTVIHVVSSSDEETWDHEASFALETDLREPRFLSLGASLFLYVARLGADTLGFTPMGVSVAERASDGTWTALEELPELGAGSFLTWRTKIERGTPYMVDYTGGENLYRLTGIPMTVELRTTADGRSWTAVDPTRLAVSMGGGTETDFTFDDDGVLWAVTRNEAGDELGWGSKVCTAPASDVTDWTCVGDPKKYDSPLVFWHDGEAYLIGRRNVTLTGYYDLMTGRGDHANQTFENLVAYSNEPKRCSLWRFVREEMRIAFILDLPSRGDTCFPGAIEGATTEEIVVYNYSSPIDGEDVDWNVGQNGPTNIYRSVLRFTRR
jgi:hypothetical protein